MAELADVDRLLVHADWLRSLARRLVGPESADDVVQETFVAAMRSPPDPDRPAKPWLGSVLRNVARMRFRGDSRRARREDAVAIEPVTSTDPAQIVQRLETHRALCDVVLSLDEPYRSTLILHYYDGLSLADIARKDAIAEGTVRWRHKEALRKLRARLDETHGGDRHAWVAALAPIAAPPAAPAATVLGGLLVKKLVIGFALALVAALVVWKVTARDSAAVTTRPAPAQPAAHLRFGQQPSMTGDATGSIHGRVLGATGPARVALFELTANDEPLFVAQQAATRFDFAHVRPGTYCVVAHAGLLAGSTCDLVVHSGDRLERNITVSGGSARLRGTVRDADAGAIAEPEIVVQRFPAVGTLYTVDGGSDGRYELALAPGWYRVIVRADGYTTARHHIEVVGERNLDVVLNAGATITGRVVDDQQRAVAGAVVSAVYGYRQSTRSATTGADGRFAIDGLRPGRFDVLATAGDRIAPPREVTLAFGATQDVELVVAEGRVALTGEVRDDNGAALAKARVEVIGPITRLAETDREGKFRITALVAGTYDVAAYADGYVRAKTSKIVPHEGTASVAMKLSRGVTVTGVVRTATGQAVARATVSSSAWNLGDPRLDVYTDASGQFRLGPLPTGAVALSAFHASHGVTELTRIELAPGSTPKAELVFDSSGAIEGSVRFDDGTPARGAMIEISTSEMPARWSIAADSDGRFVLGSLPAGSFDVGASAPVAGSTQEVAATSKTIKLTAGARERIELKLAGGSEHIRGRVVDPSGKPLAGAAVFAERAGIVISPTPADDVRAYAWNDGTFDLAELARGEYNVYASHPDYASGKLTNIKAGASGVTITLGAPAKVSGRAVTQDGKPIRSFRLQWTWISRKAPTGEVMSRESKMVEDPQGRFELANLEPTRMLIVAVETADGATGDAGPYELALGQRVDDIRIEVIGSGIVRGRLLDAATGKPALGLDVHFTTGSTREALSVDGNGRFEGSLPAGPYRQFAIQNRTQGFPQVDREFVIKTGQVTDIGDVRVDLGP